MTNRARARRLGRALRAGAMIAVLALPGAAPAQSGNPFAPAIIVNDRAISNYELEQRARILQLFRTPGNLQELAREQLVNERIQLFAAEQFDIVPSAEEIAEGMSEFAGRANLSAEEFIGRLEQAGVAAETFRDFVAAGVAWRQVVRGRFGPRAQVTEADIDRALALTSRPGTAEAFISEIILPARTPPEAARSEELALRLAGSVNTTGGFAAAARQYSVSPSRANGGQVPRPIPLENLPPALRQVILTLGPGEISAPIPIPNAIALFQLRDLRDTGRPEAEAISVEFAQYLIPGGRTPEALAVAARLDRETDRCNDLYGVNQGQPAERLIVETKTVGELPADIALELAKLDPGETSVALTRGNALVYLMLCERTIKREEELDRGLIRRRLIDQRLGAYGEAYLAELKADAIIRTP